MTDVDVDDTDDDADVDDTDDDDDGEGEGHAAVVCTTETLGARFTFVDSVEAAQLLAAQPCKTPGCLGHTVAYGDGTGRVRIIADSRDLMHRRRDALRARERRRVLRKRLYDAERMQQRRDANRETLQREDDTDGPG